MAGQLQQDLLALKDALQEAQRAGVDFSEQQPKISFLKFDQSKKTHVRNAALRTLDNVKKALTAAKQNAVAPPHIAAQLEEGLDELSHTMQPELADALAKIAGEVQDGVTKPTIQARLPAEIREVVYVDLAEMEKAFAAGIYRSAVMLCGRVLEVVLHRAYYEATQHDLLEKSPGMGLGTLLARMAERGIKIDPALGNQIHLINQARVHSVHHKHNTFMPSQAQTRAIMLYTVDVIEKVFPG